MSGSPLDGKVGWSPDDSALLLVESLIHELVAAGTLDRARAMVVVEIAIGARGEIRTDRGDAVALAFDPLRAILDTLRL